MMSDNREKLDALAHALLDQETLEQDEAYAAAGIAAPGEAAPQPSGIKHPLPG